MEKILMELSNADAIAGNEKEVRKVIEKYVPSKAWTKRNDGMGSLIYTKLSKTHPEKNIMMYAHMDEVGFMVRSVSELGLIRLIKVGGTQVKAMDHQEVRMTTRDRRKIIGILNNYSEPGQVDELYVDLGAHNDKEIADLGISTGDMVTFNSSCEPSAIDGVFMGKAMDDRLGCLVLITLMQQLSDVDLDFNLHMAFTSSEEVGIRGAKTATQLIEPDCAIIVDVATYPNPFDRSHKNQRQVGKGPLLTHFDRTLSPNQKLLYYVKDKAINNGIPLQLDLFNTGGTDGGEAHKVGKGIPTVVTILPVRMGHAPYSIVQLSDVEQTVDWHTKILTSLTSEKIESFEQFE